MIRGKVTQAGEAQVEVSLEGITGQPVKVTVTIDTGFNGFLMLPPNVIATLLLKSTGETSAILGDGSVIMTDSYEGIVDWHGQKELAHLLTSNGEALLGMSLLGGSRLTIDAIPGGEVTIEALP